MPLKQLVESLNDSTFQIFGDYIMIYTCFIMDLDLVNNSIEYVSAGHPTQLLHSNERFHKLDTTTPIIGFKKKLGAITKTIKFQAPFTILLFSDGIEELMNPNYDIFGVDNIQKSIERYFLDKSKGLFEILSQDMDKFRESSRILDDVTAIIIEKAL